MSAPAPATAAPPTTAPAPAGAPGPLTLPPPVRAVYEEAKQAVRVGDYEAARVSLEEAVRLLPDFTEGWYNLGATFTHLAIRAASQGADADAGRLFRQAVESKRTSRDLMNRERWYVYKSPGEQQQVRSDVDAGLEDAEEVLANEASLLAALRLWGAMGR